MTPSIIILTSSTREESDTKKMLYSILPANNFPCIDLLHHPIAPYNYDNNYPAGDTFLQIIEQILEKNTLLITTPVYWYSMSGLLKIFFDRLTDIVRVQKPLGRKMAGKEMVVMATGTDAALPPGFEVPFHLTANYFAMQFTGCYYYCTHKNAPPPATQEITPFLQALQLA